MRVLIAFSLLAFVITAQAQILHRWTDESGKVHYTDQPPPVGARNVEKMGSARSAEADKNSSAQRSYALQQAVKNFPVTLYTSKECGDPCKKGLAHLNKRGVPYTEKPVATRAEIDELIKLAGAPRVPFLVVGVTTLKDYEELGWDEALDTAGYPKTAAP